MFYITYLIGFVLSYFCSVRVPLLIMMNAIFCKINAQVSIEISSGYFHIALYCSFDNEISN